MGVAIGFRTYVTLRKSDEEAFQEEPFFTKEGCLG